MNIYLRKFIHRGLVFGGFGPIILGIIYAIISKTSTALTLSGTDVCLGIISIYLLAFVHAGASVFNQIEHWSIPKSLFFHLTSLYIAYTVCYFSNTWLPFNLEAFLIFTAVFVLIYFAVWITVVVCIKATQRKLNAKLD